MNRCKMQCVALRVFTSYAPPYKAYFMFLCVLAVGGGRVPSCGVQECGVTATEEGSSLHSSSGKD